MLHGCPECKTRSMYFSITRCFPLPLFIANVDPPYYKQRYATTIRISVEGFAKGVYPTERLQIYTQRR